MEMRTFFSLGLVLLGLWGGGVARAQLEIAPDATSLQCCFAGMQRPVAVMLRNPGAGAAQIDVRTRVYEMTSATAVLLTDKPWKLLEVLPGQTVLESTPIDFPVIKAETTFLVQWLEGTNRIIGRKEVLVYPTNLLAELKPLSGDAPTGVFDPQNQLKPALKSLKVEFEDLENGSIADFSGKLAVIGPFASKAQMPEGLAEKIVRLARKGTAVVWIQPPPARRDKPQPSFYVADEGRGAVVVAQAEMAADLPDNPKAQINLVYFCRLALHPASPALPNLPNAHTEQ